MESYNTENNSKKDLTRSKQLEQIEKIAKDNDELGVAKEIRKRINNKEVVK